MATSKGIRAGRAFVELFADDSKLVRGLKAAEAKVMAFGRSMQTLGKGMMALSGAVLAPLVGSAKVFANMGDAVAKMSKRTGVSAETLSELRFVAAQTGTEFEALEVAFRKMQRNIYDAGRGISTAVDALAALGLEFKDLDGLKPEDQFKRLADRIGALTDPTKRAAIAMMLFGRTGTNLLPMFAVGAQGIEAMQEQARQLGLTMSTQDAAAAEALTDAFQAMLSVLKRGVFVVGSALAPVLQRAAEWLTTVAVKSADWLRENKGLIVNLLKTAVAVGAAGAALVAFGKALTTIVGLTARLGGVKLLGLAAVGAGVAYIVKQTDAGGKAVRRLGDHFTELRSRAEETYSAISDAMAGGDIALAAKVLWLGLRVEWTRGANALEETWLRATHRMKQEIHSAWTGLTMGIEAIWHGLEVAWIEVTSFMAKTWIDMNRQMEVSGLKLAKTLLRAWASMKELASGIAHGRSPSQMQRRTEARHAEIEGGHEIQKASTEKAAAEQKADVEARRRQARQEAASLHEQVLSKLASELVGKLDAMGEDYAQRLSQNETDLAEAVRQFRQAVADAKTTRWLAEAETAASQAGRGLDAAIKDALAGLGDCMELQVERARGFGAAGTFNAAALLGLQAGGVQDRIANATERTAKGVESLRQDVRNNVATFS